MGYPPAKDDDEYDYSVIEDMLQRGDSQGLYDRSQDQTASPRDRDEANQAAMMDELASPLSPTEYDAAYRQNVWEDEEPEPKPTGIGLAAQGIVDEMSPSIAPEPAGPGNYVWDHDAQSYTPEADLYQEGRDYDVDARGPEWAAIPTKGPLAGERVKIPEGYDHDALEALMREAADGRLGGRHRQMPPDTADEPPSAVATGPAELHAGSAGGPEAPAAPRLEPDPAVPPVAVPADPVDRQRVVGFGRQREFWKK